MPQRITCPSCSRTLNLPDELLGREVRCPSCQSMFTATATPESAPSGVSPPPPPPEDRPSRRPDDDDEDRPSRQPPRDDDGYGRRAHRGGLILGLGIPSLVVPLLGVLFFICCGGVGMMLFGLISIGLGLPAWLLGQSDLAAMRAGTMDRSGESSTKAGWMCGIIGTVLGGLSLFCGGVALVVGIAIMASGGGK